jgi:hypothetical protein
MPPAATIGVVAPDARTARRGRQRQVAAERSARVGRDRRHALVAGRSGVGVRGRADFRLRGVVELAALRHRNEVGARAREGDGVVRRVVDVASSRDRLVAEHAQADRDVRADGGAHGGEDFERQPQPAVARAAVAVRAVVRPREERRHRVGVRIVQFHAVEPGVAGAARGGGEERRQRPRQVAHVRQSDVGHALAVAVVERLGLARRQRPAGFRDRQRGQRGADGVVGRGAPRGVAGPRREEGAVAVRRGEKLPEVFRRLGTAAHGEEVDELDEELRASAARGADGVRQPAQSGNEAVVSDAQQGTGRHVADAGRFDDEPAGKSSCESRVPVDDGVGDETFVGRAPRDHRGHPRAGAQGQRADPYG